MVYYYVMCVSLIQILYYVVGPYNHPNLKVASSFEYWFFFVTCFLLTTIYVCTHLPYIILYCFNVFVSAILHMLTHYNRFCIIANFIDLPSQIQNNRLFQYRLTALVEMRHISILSRYIDTMQSPNWLLVE